ncbi:MAG: hypothetical protein WD066_18300 [Planctomycetaceae bacterium]
MDRIREKISDGRVLTLIEMFLKQGVLDDPGSLDTGNRIGCPSPIAAPILRFRDHRRGRLWHGPHQE